MDDLVSMLPIMDLALKAIQVAERCALICDFIEFIKQMSEQLNKYTSWCTLGKYGCHYLIKCALL